MQQQRLDKKAKHVIQNAQRKVSEIYQDSPKEELASAITHGIAIVLSIWALVEMLYVVEDQNTKKLISVWVFGLSMILVYTFSTLLHIFYNHKLTYIFLLLDHAAIFVLIAGTYTPYTLITLEKSEGLYLLTFVWAFALGGILYKVFLLNRYKRFSLMLYLFLGWLGALKYEELSNHLGEGFDWLLIGGALYSIGVVFYVWRKLPYNHAIWHIFVIGGNFAIFYSVYAYVLLR
ncbi:PAQR family membrane homeostasis protein TrhA [Sediminitomix flava]|uniref:Hemolysin III n=1 Tax=Sediminitomix flava TaxID=379075 RepID=A0A315ZHX9_SEDFL|nr:hemolysin III family protein [Sediminitomix flava]PWJ44823.1 hemolysin III [Sediminitomix flava]